MPPPGCTESSTWLITTPVSYFIDSVPFFFFYINLLTCIFFLLTCHKICMKWHMCALLQSPCREAGNTLYLRFLPPIHSSLPDLVQSVCVSWVCVCRCLPGPTIRMWWRCNEPSEWRGGGPTLLHSCYTRTANKTSRLASSRAVRGAGLSEASYLPAQTESWQTSGVVCSAWRCRCPLCSPCWCGSGCASGGSPAKPTERTCGCLCVWSLLCAAAAAAAPLNLTVEAACIFHRKPTDSLTEHIYYQSIRQLLWGEHVCCTADRQKHKENCNLTQDSTKELV